MLRRFHYAGLRERGRDLLHAIDKIDGGSRRQDQAAGWIATAADRRIGSDVVEAGDTEFDAERLSVSADSVGSPRKQNSVD